MDYLVYSAPAAGVLALIFAYFKALSVSKKDAGDETMQRIATSIQEGAMAFLKQEYKFMAIFMVQGTVIGVVGTLIGALLGIVAALNVSSLIAAIEKLLGIKFLNADVYFIDYLPSQLQSADVVMVCAAALLLSFFATLYPAWRAARTQPAEALRYE